jgi:hypothetical protein
MFYSLPGCLATLITDYSVCLLLCFLACHTFQWYVLVSFLFHLGMFPVPCPQFAVVFLQVLHIFSGYSVFHLPVCTVYVFSLYFYGEGCHSSVDEDSRDIMLCRSVCT